MTRPIGRPRYNSPEGRQVFVEQHYSMVASYLTARWRGSQMSAYIEDASQDVFVECFRENGPLSRVEGIRPDRFKAFFYGIVRNIARRVEYQTGRAKLAGNSDAALSTIESQEQCVSLQLDRTWAIKVLRTALARQEQRARDKGDSASRRVELLRLRFHENMPIRRIAEKWQEDAKLLHREYAKARTDYLNALREVVREQNVNSTNGEVETKCRTLLELLH